MVVSCVLSHWGRVLWGEPTATIETGVLHLQVQSCGTAFQLICDKLTLAYNNLSRYRTKNIFVRVLRSQRIVTKLLNLCLWVTYLLTLELNMQQACFTVTPRTLHSSTQHRTTETQQLNHRIGRTAAAYIHCRNRPALAGSCWQPLLLMPPCHGSAPANISSDCPSAALHTPFSSVTQRHNYSSTHILTNKWSRCHQSNTDTHHTDGQYTGSL